MTRDRTVVGRGRGGQHRSGAMRLGVNSGVCGAMQESTQPTTDSTAPSHAPPPPPSSLCCALHCLTHTHTLLLLPTPSASPPPALPSFLSHPSPPPPLSLRPFLRRQCNSVMDRAPPSPRPSVRRKPPPRPPPRRPRRNRPRRRPPLKLVVRRLPPMLSPDAFFALANACGADKACWKTFYPGVSQTTGSVKRTMHVVRHAVAYLAFDRVEDALTFHDAFDGMKIADPMKTASPSLHTGHEYYAIVERAMSQMVPTPHQRKPPPQAATIQNDPHYLQFLKHLDAQQALKPSSLPQPSALAPPEKKRDPKQMTITPLMEDVRMRRKERETKRKPKPSPRPPRKPRLLDPKSPDHPSRAHGHHHFQPHLKSINAKKKKDKRRLQDTAAAAASANAATATSVNVAASSASSSPSRHDNNPVAHSPNGKPIVHVKHSGAVKPGTSAKSSPRNGTFARHHNHVHDNNARLTSPTSHARANSPFANHPGSEVNTSSNNKVTPPRSQNGRTRYNRGGRGRGPSNAHVRSQNLSNIAPIPMADNIPGGSVRLLKKEASSVAKT